MFLFTIFLGVLVLGSSNSDPTDRLLNSETSAQSFYPPSRTLESVKGEILALKEVYAKAKEPFITAHDQGLISNKFKPFTIQATEAGDVTFQKDKLQWLSLGVDESILEKLLENIKKAPEEAFVEKVDELVQFILPELMDPNKLEQDTAKNEALVNHAEKLTEKMKTEEFENLDSLTKKKRIEFRDALLMATDERSRFKFMDARIRTAGRKIRMQDAAYSGKKTRGGGLSFPHIDFIIDKDLKDEDYEIRTVNIWIPISKEVKNWHLGFMKVDPRFLRKTKFTKKTEDVYLHHNPDTIAKKLTELQASKLKELNPKLHELELTSKIAVDKQPKDEDLKEIKEQPAKEVEGNTPGIFGATVQQNQLEGGIAIYKKMKFGDAVVFQSSVDEQQLESESESIGKDEMVFAHFAFRDLTDTENTSRESLEIRFWDIVPRIITPSNSGSSGRSEKVQFLK